MGKEIKKAVILAGGKGTRLYPITYEIPKPLLPIRRKPIINYLVDLFKGYGVEDITVLINKEFRNEFDWWKKRHYEGENIDFFEEEKPMGTFGAFWELRDKLESSDFFVTNGDELKEVDLEKMADFHKKKGLAGTLALVNVENPEDYGVVITKDGVVNEFLEKPEDPPSNYINSGLYLFSPEVFDYHPGKGFVMVEKHIFPRLAKDNNLAGFKFEGRWTDCGTWDRYEKALKEWE